MARLPKLEINIPNILTVIRILLTPVFVICLIRGWYVLSLFLFAAAGISDALDGLIARYLNQRSKLGALLDPIADKLLLTAAFISLAVLKIFPGWLTVIVISRDVVIALGVAVFALTGVSFEIRPSLASKATTASQITTVCFVLLNPHFPGSAELERALFWTTAGMTTLSGLHYTYLGLNILQRGSGGNGDGNDQAC